MWTSLICTMRKPSRARGQRASGISTRTPAGGARAERSPKPVATRPSRTTSAARGAAAPPAATPSLAADAVVPARKSAASLTQSASSARKAKPIQSEAGQAIQRAAYLASADIAREKGAFPLFDKDKYLAGETVRTLDEDVRAAIAEHGIRNALLTSVAPTGTISIFADNVSSGLEPVFSFTYNRNVLMPDGSHKQEEVSDYAYRLFHRSKGEDTPLPDAFVDAQHLSPSEHVIMQAAVQKYVDSSISKTINCPEEISFDVERLVPHLGARFHLGKAVRLERSERRVVLEDGRALPYDLVSFNLGSGLAGADLVASDRSRVGEVMEICGTRFTLV